jgi:hypothetical protein
MESIGTRCRSRERYAGNLLKKLRGRLLVPWGPSAKFFREVRPVIGILNAIHETDIMTLLIRVDPFDAGWEVHVSSPATRNECNDLKVVPKCPNRTMGRMAG